MLDPSQPNWLVTNENSANLLRVFDGHVSIGDVLSTIGSSGSPRYISAYNVIAKALELGILRIGRLPYSRARKKTLSSVHLTLTRKCNLHCIYCYADAGKPNQSELTTGDWQDIVSQIYSLSGSINFVLTGGEPTLFNGLEQLISHIRSFDCTAQLITNGCWDKHLNLQSISRLFNQIIVSIDGSSSKINDLHRGVGTFKKAFNTVNLLREHEANVQIAVVVTKINVEDISSIRSLFEPMGVSVNFNRFIPWAEGQLDVIS
jgi:MoaA/NifB/PqqE/SkfB family radical SAM enzyme